MRYVFQNAHLPETWCVFATVVCMTNPGLQVFHDAFQKYLFGALALLGPKLWTCPLWQVPWTNLTCGINARDWAYTMTMTPMKWANRLEYPIDEESPCEIRSLPISDDLAHNFNMRVDKFGYHRLSWDDTFGTYMMLLSNCGHC